MKLCECGCNREVKGTEKKRFHSRSCYPAAKRATAKKKEETRIRRKNKQNVGIHKICECPCRRPFIDTSPNKGRIFYDRGTCRYQYFKANKEYTGECKTRGRRGSRTVKSERPDNLPCHRKGLFSGVIACGKYTDCLELLAQNTGTWEFVENGGVDCWQDPKKVSPNTMGGSFDGAISPGFNYIY